MTQLRTVHIEFHTLKVQQNPLDLSEKKNVTIYYFPVPLLPLVTDSTLPRVKRRHLLDSTTALCNLLFLTTAVSNNSLPQGQVYLPTLCGPT